MANLTTLPPHFHDAIRRLEAAGHRIAIIRYQLGPVDHPAYATATELYRTPTTTQETHP